MAVSHPPPSERTRIRRKADRARYDEETIFAILDEALVCHVGFAVHNRPWVFPTAFARIGEHIFIHGAAGNFALRTLVSGAEACVTVTLLDGLVLARSAFQHSMNYRSVMLFGHATEVSGLDEKREALLAIVDQMVPGRSSSSRPPSVRELRSTLVVRLPLDEASAKIRAGGPIENMGDDELPYWSGVVPLTVVRGEPQATRPAK
jgi:nitroimidazol reductase NimA-like FMN-containing flavoprotein (pyridoxamine 5'-phosphate oxidase superfamily)